MTNWAQFGILLAIYLIESVKYCLGTEIFFRRTIRRKWIFAVGFAVLTVGLLTVDFGYEEAMLFMYGVVFAGLAIGMRQGGKGKGADVFLLILLMTSLDETISAVTKFFAEGMGESGRVTYPKTLVDTVIVLIFLCSIKLLVKKNLHKKFLQKAYVSVLIKSCLILTLVLIAILGYTRTYVDNKHFNIFIGIVVAVSYMGFFLITWLLVLSRSENEKTKKELEIERYLKEQQVNYFLRLLEKEEETRRFRHDIGNHLIVLSDLVASGDMERVKRYLGKMNGHLREIRGRTYVTGSEMLDIILGDTMDGVCRCDQVRVLGEFHCLEQLEEIDFCTIFYNLLSNVAEALEKLEEDERYLMIEMVKGEKNFAVILKNPVNEVVKMNRNGLPKTTKGKTVYHGMGLKNVVEAMKKNNGEMEISCEQKEFMVRLYFPRKAPIQGNENR